MAQSLRELANRWRCEADELRERYGDERSARLCENHARELEEAVRGDGDPFDAREIAAEIVSRVLQKQGL